MKYNYSKRQNLLLIISIFILGINAIVAQHKNLNTKKDVEIIKTSTDKEVLLDVLDNKKIMMLNLSCNVHSGSITIEVYNPNGKKEEKFSVIMNKTNDKKERVINTNNVLSKVTSGMIDKVFHNPLSGIWKIKIIPKNAKGHISISMNQR